MAAHRIDTHHHPYPPVYIQKTDQVLKQTTHAFNVIPNIPPPTIEFPFDTTRAITSLLFSGTLHRCSNIKWIFSHGGGALPMVANRLAGLAKNRPELSARVPNGVMHELAKLYVD